ncbi:MAG: MFS transporter [Caldilineaceae bacterium]|nr:MFS transporter [Caldilineaceae bacterium]
MDSNHSNIRFAANIPRYFAYTSLKGLHFGLITAMWVIFLQQQHGLSLTQVTFVDVAFWIAVTLGEVPTGVVADTMGRKTSLGIGTALMGVSILAWAWAFAPTAPLIILTYAALAVGSTFLSGAEDALFFETLQITGRAGEYTRLAGRASAIRLGSVAIGNLASGLLATLDLRLPFIIAGLCLLTMLAIVLTFKEPRSTEETGGLVRQSYGEILRQSITLIRTRPTLLYPLIYLGLVPMTAVIMETVFLQPQALALGVPLAGVGVVVMAVQFMNMAGSTASHQLKVRFGEASFLTAAPFLIVASLILLAAYQAMPALLFVAVIGFVTAALRPLVMSRIHNEVPDAIRATVFSLQALIFTILVAMTEPLLGFVADQSGLPAAYVGLAGTLALLSLLLFWKSRPHFP